MHYTLFQKASELGSFPSMLRRWIAIQLRKRSAFLDVLPPVVRDPRPDVPRVTDDRGLIARRAEEVARFYLGNMELTEALAKDYGFKFLLFLQPTLFTKAQKSSEEMVLLEKVRSRMPSVEWAHVATYDAIRRRMSRNKPDIFEDTSAVYAGDPRSLYSDFAHVSPNGNRSVAQEIADILSRRGYLPGAGASTQAGAVRPD